MKYFFFCFILFSNVLFAQQKYEADWKSIDSRPNPAWFEDAKFGIFIHWGLFSVPAWGPTDRDFKGLAGNDWGNRIGMKYAEWYWQRINTPENKNKFGYKEFLEHHEKTYGKDFKYQDFTKNFNAEYFDPEQWAEILNNSGAKYVVLTSKHHEGFTLWPSAQSWNWNAVDVGPHRDLLGDLTKSVKNKGLKMGYYYSLYEWFNPLYKPETIDRYVNEHMLPQMKDLVNSYKPDILWGDGQWDYSSSVWKMPEFMAWLYNESPVKETIVINDRWGKDTWGEHGGYSTVEYGNLKDKMVDMKTIQKPWEESKGIGFSFGYNKNENLEDYASSQQLVHDLIGKVAMGGNLLLNIGPTADGHIPVIMQQRLSDIGKWLNINGEAIYGTRKWTDAPPITKTTNIYYTKKGKDLYLISTKFPERDIVIDHIKKPGNVKMLGLKFNVTTSYKNGSLNIVIPKVTPLTNPCDYAWVFKIENAL